ncbi:hypothetical protein T440DRAFT_99275 [Plenodomus tracheiphilus IPT5]|uniref:C4-dicarboxylate transporter/malic acid transport protein-like protein n=1 Tax=Plenodomus tracheiphilus IPT5 TaxID=1408161 RepID=A0A6A7BKW0_9PLEO|nr:hypothetical protein T440DRAFT_99275 [Plenodomus tracheiphilus IPT5]
MAPNGHTTEHDALQIPKEHQSNLSIAIKNFSAQWYTISMDTGILSIILKLHPWTFRGQSVLSTVMFVLNLFLFVAFSAISILRLRGHRHHVRTQTLTNLEEQSYLGAPATAYLTLVAQVALTCSTAWGFHWTIFAYVLWWIGLVFTVGLCSSNVIILIKRNMTTDREMTPAIFLPLISVMTLGTTGGIICNYGVGMTPALAVPIIVVAYMAIGYALFLSLMYYTFLAHKLLAVGLPAPGKVPALVITVGPMGQFATAIQVLSTAASKRGLFAGYARGTWLQGSAASSVSAAAVLLALLALGFAFMWITVAWCIVMEHLIKRQLPFSLTWWSLIFPMGVFTTALLNLSNALNSSVLRGFTSALLIFMFLVYFVNWGGTVYKIYMGEALGVPQQRQEEHQQAKDKKRRMDHYVMRDSRITEGESSGNGSGSNV